MTHQVSESLTYQGQELSLRTYPLDTYLEQLTPPMPLPFVGTHLRRSYEGRWAFEDNTLVLKELQLYVFTYADQIRFSSPRHVVGLEHLFPNQPEGVHAGWYSGEMHCIRGKFLQRIYPGPFGEYEEDLFFTVRAGELANVRSVRNGTAPAGNQEV
jgi:hypothetical protein